MAVDVSYRHRIQHGPSLADELDSVVHRSENQEVEHLHPAEVDRKAAVACSLSVAFPIE